MKNALPPDLNRSNACCFTGHRKITPERSRRLASDLTAIIGILADNGYRYFICGGALGFDTIAAQAVISASSLNNDIRLILALPCPEQTEKWHFMDDGEALVREYERIKGLADTVVYISEMYTPDCMRKRNQYMVDHSSFCIAYYSGSARSGTGQTYRMAVSSGLNVYNLYDNGTVEGTFGE